MFNGSLAVFFELPIIIIREQFIPFLNIILALPRRAVKDHGTNVQLFALFCLRSSALCTPIYTLKAEKT